MNLKQNLFYSKNREYIPHINLKNGLVNSLGKNIEFDPSIIKSKIFENPVITGYIVKKSLLTHNSDVYIDNSDSPIIGYRNALLVGWGLVKILLIIGL